MNYFIAVSRGAAEDVADAADYYERQEMGLGGRFRKDVDDLLEFLQRNPRIYPVSVQSYRRGRLHAFPYLVYYKITDDVVRVVAVEHASREPGRWLEHPRD